MHEFLNPLEGQRAALCATFMDVWQHIPPGTFIDFSDHPYPLRPHDGCLTKLRDVRTSDDGTVNEIIAHLTHVPVTPLSRLKYGPPRDITTVIAFTNEGDELRVTAFINPQGARKGMISFSITPQGDVRAGERAVIHASSFLNIQLLLLNHLIEIGASHIPLENDEPRITAEDILKYGISPHPGELQLPFPLEDWPLQPGERGDALGLFRLLHLEPGQSYDRFHVIDKIFKILEKGCEATTLNTEDLYILLSFAISILASPKAQEEYKNIDHEQFWRDAQYAHITTRRFLMTARLDQAARLLSKEFRA